MEKVRLAPELAYQLNDLIDVLFIAEYFGFKQTAIDYVTDIENFIYTIPNQKHKICKNKKHGIYFCKYKRNHHTTWYIIFDKVNEFYLIKYITNNHTTDYLSLV
ncbi:hypothetical protein [Ferruginibacter sp.]